MVTDTATAQAMDGFLASVERRAYRMAVIATRDRDEALDIVQDAMLKLARGYADRQSDEWGPLFTRILQSTILDWHRRRTVRHRWRVILGGQSKESSEEDADDPLETTIAAPGPTPDVQLQQQIAIDVLEQALAQLPIRQQQVFLLRQWEGLDVAQTAAAMSISTGSVKTHYSRALETLRHFLEEHW